MITRRLTSKLFFVLVCVFIVWAFSAESYGKHIIVSYDTSGSMYKLRGQVLMDEDDRKRVNDYLLDLLFSQISRLYDSEDSAIAPSLADFPIEQLYQSGDKLSYLKFHTTVQIVFRKSTYVSRDDLRRKLPNPSTPSSSFSGNDTYLDKAKLKIYDELYTPGEETYWIMVSDEDQDISIMGRRNPDALRRLNELVAKYDEQIVYHLLVNGRVNIKVHKIVPREEGPSPITGIDTVYIVSDTTKQPPVTIAFSKDLTLKSETLLIDTENESKQRFAIESVAVKALNSNREVIHSTSAPVGGTPPCTFNIRLPADKTGIAERDNKLQLVVKYEYMGREKESSPYEFRCNLIIDTVYISNKDGRKLTSLDKIKFESQDGRFQSSKLFVDTESHVKDDFSIDTVEAKILNKDGMEIYNKEIPLNGAPPPQSFTVELSENDKELKKRTNSMQFGVKYSYKNTPKEQSIGDNFSYSLPGSSPVIPLIILLLLALLGGVGFCIAKFLLPKFQGMKTVDFHLRVQDDISGKNQSFSLNDGEILGLSSNSSYQKYFDVDCSDSTLKNQGGKIFLTKPPDVSTPLTDGQTFEITDSRDVNVEILFSTSTQQTGRPAEKEEEVGIFSSSSSPDTTGTALDEL